ncbi:MAG: hypothetical protein ACFFEO_11290 [Candidatus Thorarchaeota archaeon]
MERSKILRIIAGSLCIVVAVLRILLFFLDLSGAIIYSMVFIDPSEAVSLIQGILIIFLAFIFTSIATIAAVGIYLALGVLQIVLKRFKTVTIVCNVIIAISIIMCVRAIYIYISINELHILLISLLILYIIIFIICIVSYTKVRKEE